MTKKKTRPSVSPIGDKKDKEFRIELVSGNDYASLEQAQEALLATSFDKLLADAVRQDLETGAFVIVDGRVVIADKIKDIHPQPGQSPL